MTASRCAFMVHRYVRGYICGQPLFRRDTSLCSIRPRGQRHMSSISISRAHTLVSDGRTFNRRWNVDPYPVFPGAGTSFYL